MSRAWSIRATMVCAVALVAALVPATAASAATVFYPVADAYVDGSRPSNNYGSRPFLRTDASPDRIAYLRFDVTGQGQSGSSLLRIHADSSNDGFTVHEVADNTWSEQTINYSNRPAVGPAIASTTSRVASGTWIEVDVSSFVGGDGVFSLAITTSDNTALKLTSREGANPPELIVPAPAVTSLYTITGSGNQYTATPDTGSAINGTLKTVVEAAASVLETHGGGTVVFAAGVFDLGSDHFELDDVDAITFEGQGVDVTTITNFTGAADDTEVFDLVHADHIIIRDMTLSAGGPVRLSSDAIDFDDGRNSTVERVKIVASRGRGIVFDGKGVGWAATGNTVSNCIIENVPGDGIELLAASQNVIEECVISGTGGHGIQVTKASAVASVPNKQSDDNIIRNNTIDRSGKDGLNVNSSDDNIVVGNVISNSSQVASGRDGIRIESFNGISCDRTDVQSNSLFDNQATATQKFGLKIADPECDATVVGEFNSYAGNRIGDIKDLGTNTVYPADTAAPSTPSNVSASAVSHAEVAVSWDASTDNVAVDGYTIYRNGSNVGTVGGATTSFNDTSVTANTSYAYTVDAFDAAGNYSPQSAPPAQVTTPPAPSNFTVDAEADAYINGSNPTATYGTSTQLRVDGSPQLRSFVRFTVSGGGGPVTAATFRIRAGSSHSQGFELRSVADNGWMESTISFSNAPTVGAVVGVSGPTTAGQYVEIDVGGVVTAEGTYTFALVPINNTNLRLSSRETGAGPELVVSQ